MPISAFQSVLSSSLQSSFNLGLSANPSRVNSFKKTALSAMLSTGIVSYVPKPLIVAGMEGAFSIINNSLSQTTPASNNSITASIEASAISLIAPEALPIGLALLRTQIEQLRSLGLSANPIQVSNLYAVAIITYYTMGLIV